jgi:hypothetical protein
VLHDKEAYRVETAIMWLIVVEIALSLVHVGPELYGMLPFG